MDFRSFACHRRARHCRVRTITLGLLATVWWIGATAGCREHQAGPPSDGPPPAPPWAIEQVGDLDGDGLQDDLEDVLATQFAPIVFHGDRETTFPTSVDSWLARTHLNLIGERGSAQRVESGPLRQLQLLDHRAVIDGVTVSSNGTRTRGKRVSFVLENVSPDAGSEVHPDDWVTYVHSYPNTQGGVTLQYWRAYPRNDASWLGFDLSHGGDWEAIAVHLDPNGRAVKITYLDHAGIVDVSQSVRWEGSHPLVWSEEGGHSSHTDASHSRSTRWFRHETWTGGDVTRWDLARVGTSGGLRNVGEKTRPRRGQVFIQYSGLWGSRGYLFMTSGYWGPAFNETDATCDNGAPAYRPYVRRPAERADCGRIYLKAWCDGADATRLNLHAECYADADVP